MPELRLGIGREVGTHGGWTREWLYWYDEQGNRYPAPEDVIEQERQLRRTSEHIAEQERQARLQAEQQLQQLLERLRQRGINPDKL